MEVFLVQGLARIWSLGVSIPEVLEVFVDRAEGEFGVGEESCGTRGILQFFQLMWPHQGCLGGEMWKKKDESTKQCLCRVSPS